VGELVLNTKKAYITVHCEANQTIFAETTYGAP